MPRSSVDDFAGWCFTTRDAGYFTMAQHKSNILSKHPFDDPAG
jgi:hypothetical protein